MNKDAFEQRLQNNLAVLKECQKNKAIDSCLKCEKLLECSIRENYVKAVYESMNKGKNGSFEF